MTGGKRGGLVEKEQFCISRLHDTPGAALEIGYADDPMARSLVSFDAPVVVNFAPPVAHHQTARRRGDDFTKWRDAIGQGRWTAGHGPYPDEHGEMTQIYPSPNHNERRLGPPDMVVIHYTDMIDWDETHARLCDPVAEVSAHWLIALDGRTEQLVDEARRAWHAGVSEWGGVMDVNSRSIGIELMNAGHSNGLHPFPAAQMDALVVLLRAINTRWHVQPENVVGHEHVAPGRKIDPGPKFDWARLQRLGLANPPVK